MKTLLLRILDTATIVLIGLALTARVSGGLHTTIGPIRISATDASRLFVEAALVAVIRQLVVIGVATGAQPRRTVGALLGVLLAALALDAGPQHVGDGTQYMAMALNLAHTRLPAMSADERRQVQTRIASVPGYEEAEIRAEPRLRGRDGRYDQEHFWFYSALAAPFIAVANRIGIQASAAFTFVNLALLLTAAGVMLRVAVPATTVLVIAGPILWWIDKAHPEAFTFALLLIGILLMRLGSVWALVAIAIAATQNPPIGVLLALVFLRLFRAYGLKPHFVAVAATALAIAALHPVYSWWRLGTWSALSATTVLHWPSTVAWLTPIVDPNLGILIHFAGLPVLLLVSMLTPRSNTAPTRQALRREPNVQAARWDGWIVAVTAIVFLFSFAQTMNVNHGGTVGISRYGLWLVPLAVPAVLNAERRLIATAHQRWLVALAVCSLAWSAYAFHPRWTANNRDASPLAMWLWTHVPSLNNPLPEVFAERIGGMDGIHALPVATARCEKILLFGNGTPEVNWPAPCPPAEVPRFCTAKGAVCYANGRPGAYQFLHPPQQPAFGGYPMTEGVWKLSAREPVETLLRSLGGSDLRIARADKTDSLIRGAAHFTRIYVVRSSAGALMWIARDRAPASLDVHVPNGAAVTFLNAEDMVKLSTVTLSPSTKHRLSLPDIPVTIILLHLNKRAYSFSR